MKNLNNYNLLNDHDINEDLARAISMDELLEQVEKHIHELYQNQNYENKNNSHTRSFEILQQTY